MVCPACKNETAPALFCQVCDVFLPQPAVGTKAGVGRRLWAHILDIVIFWAILFAVLLLGGVIGLAGAGSNSTASSVFAGLGLMTVFVAIIAYAVFLLKFLGRGKTPGKAAAGVHVIDKRTGANPGIGRMLVRETFGKLVSGFFLALGYLWAIFDKDGQAWHDKIAGTVIVRDATIVSVPQAYKKAAGG